MSLVRGYVIGTLLGRMLSALIRLIFWFFRQLHRLVTYLMYGRKARR